MPGWVRTIALVAITMSALGASAAARADDAERGKALYEARCSGCHDRSVHGRETRSARSFEQIREFVVRWDRELGAQWKADEIDVVTRYLNERYYRYPCPTSVCAARAPSSNR